MTLYPESSSIILKLAEYNMELLNSELRSMGYTLAFMCPDGGFYNDLIQRATTEHYFDQAFGELFTLYGKDYIAESLAIKFTNKPRKINGIRHWCLMPLLIILEITTCHLTCPSIPNLVHAQLSSTHCSRPIVMRTK